MKNDLNILIAGVAMWCGGILLAPIIISIHPLGESFAKFLYRFYGVVCHQFDSRSFHVHEHSFTVCIRCTAIYFGFFISLVVIRFSSGLYHKHFDPHYIIICSATPLLLDVVFSFTSFYEISTLSRLISGVILGIGLALLLHRSLTETISSLKLFKYHDIKTR